MSIASNLLPRIQKIIDKFGSVVVVNKYTQSYIDGKMQDVLASAISVKADISGYESSELQGLIQANDLRVTIANDNFTIDKSMDKILFFGEEYNIINVMPIVFQDIVLTYEMQVRQ